MKHTIECNVLVTFYHSFLCIHGKHIMPLLSRGLYLQLLFWAKLLHFNKSCKTNTGCVQKASAWDKYDILKFFSFVPVEVAESKRVVLAISTSANATGLSLRRGRLCWVFLINIRSNENLVGKHVSMNYIKQWTIADVELQCEKRSWDIL